MAVFVPAIKRTSNEMALQFPKPQISSLGVLLGVISVVIGVAITGVTERPWGALTGILVGAYLLFAIRVAKQWEKCAVLRLGKFIGLRGPGVFHVIPVIDTISKYVDQRVRVTDVTAESALTRDTVPVNVDAIVFWGGLERREVDLGSGRLHLRSRSQRPDSATRVHRASRTGADDHRARIARA